MSKKIQFNTVTIIFVDMHYPYSHKYKKDRKVFEAEKSILEKFPTCVKSVS